MKFLADENIGLAVINPLRRLGFDIKSIKEIKPGLKDPEVLSLANRENRVLITTDKDFGELVFVNKLAHTGVILLRLKRETTNTKFLVLRRLFKKNLQLLHAFTVVSEKQIRIRRFK